MSEISEGCTANGPKQITSLERIFNKLLGIVDNLEGEIQYMRNKLNALDVDTINQLLKEPKEVGDRGDRIQENPISVIAKFDLLLDRLRNIQVRASENSRIIEKII